MKKHTLSALRLGALLAALPLAACCAPLPGLGADLGKTTVSGISSGGFMAAQLAVAYSADIMGVAVVAAGPYFCAGTYSSLSYLDNAMTTCMNPASPAVTANGEASWQAAARFARARQIDDVAALRRQRVYLFSGASDSTVKTVVVDQVARFYRLAGTPAANIVYQNTVNAGHSFVTSHAGDADCATTAPPFINNCGFEQSHQLLSHLYSPATRPANQGAPAGKLIAFEQSEFVKGKRSSMDGQAYVYVPDACRQQSCAVHVAFHGCLQGASVIGARFYNGTGYNAFADNNRLIILYPQVHPSPGIPANPQGCWDFWGYSDEQQDAPVFPTKHASQMSAVMAMVRRLGAPVTAAPSTQP
jgi:poly(3-hydroxybutyrate) depolymerase